MIIYAFTIIFIMLIVSTLFDVFILYPILFALFLFSMIVVKRGWPLKKVLKMLFQGAMKTWPVVQIFTLIGILIGLWFSSGTIAWIVYNGLSLIIPELFILFAFLVSTLVSFLLGTSFGTVGTIGIILIIMAQTGNISMAPLVGAIMSGAYVGDRNSPMSSSVHLVATVTKTNIYSNIKNMFKTGFIPLVLASLFYLILSFIYPFTSSDSTLISRIPISFNLSFLCALPIIGLIVLVLLKINVKIAMICASLIALILTVITQKMETLDLLKTMIFGFSLKPADPLVEIFRGGGVAFMFNAMLIVLASSAFAGLFEHTDLIVAFEKKIESLAQKTYPFFTTVITSIITSSLGVTQALAIIMSEQLLKKPYALEGKNNYHLALDIADSAVVISVLIPWNVASLIPAKMLGFDARFIPFAFFLYILPFYRMMIGGRAGLKANRKK
ncbi:MAG: Na+/H+ antiporter NhaC family protein [Thermotogota bacterium]|nr:Na+/H+ antiporter NhaC family protein [Thermotogota bacterium]